MPKSYWFKSERSGRLKCRANPCCGFDVQTKLSPKLRFLNLTLAENVENERKPHSQGKFRFEQVERGTQRYNDDTTLLLIVARPRWNEP